MNLDNPWQVDNLDAFSFLCCPECNFKSKLTDNDTFEAHAVENHPLAKSFFDKTLLPIKLETDELHWEADEEDNEPVIQLRVSQGQQVDQIQGVKFEYIQDDLDEPLKKKFECEFCNTVFDKKPPLFEHMKKVHVQVPCDQCYETFSSIGKLKLHRREKHQPVTCQECGKFFKSKYSYKVHFKHAHEPNGQVYHCELCAFKTKHKHYLIKHKEKVHDNKVIKCDQCGFSTNTETNLKNHLDRVHSDKSNKCYQCDQCSYKTHSKIYMYDHKSKIHSNATKIEELEGHNGLSSTLFNLFQSSTLIFIKKL